MLGESQRIENAVGGNYEFGYVTCLQCDPSNLVSLDELVSKPVVGKCLVSYKNCPCPTFYSIDFVGQHATISRL